jgi:hypothetical protein
MNRHCSVNDIGFLPPEPLTSTAPGTSALTWWQKAGSDPRRHGALGQATAARPGTFEQIFNVGHAIFLQLALFWEKLAPAAWYPIGSISRVPLKGGSMNPSDNLPELAVLAARPSPLGLHWPMPGDLGAMLRFVDARQWREFVLSLGVHPSLPEIARQKFYRAQKLHYLGWIDVDLIKAGELCALVALELALKDRYLGKIQAVRRAAGKKPSRTNFQRLLTHMVKEDGLTNEMLPIYLRTGGDPIARVLGKAKPSLADIRNSLAHGYPFDGLPQAGLLELVRDLINFAYRGWIEERLRPA